MYRQYIKSLQTFSSVVFTSIFHAPRVPLRRTINENYCMHTRIFNYYFGLSAKCETILRNVHVCNNRRILRFSILFTPFSHHHIYLRACVHFSTHVSALALRDTQSTKPARMTRIGHLAPTLVRTTNEYRRFISRYLTCVSFRPCGMLPYLLALSLLFSLPSSVRRSKEAKVEANHHAITAPGAAGTPIRSQKAATAFCRPGAFTTAVPVLQNQQSSSCAAEKKSTRSPRFPPPFRQITGGPSDRPTTGIRGIHRGE